MTIERMEGGGVVVTGEEDIQFARMLTLKHALHLETMGMSRRGRSVYSIVKEEFGLKGSKQKVYDQFCKMVDAEMEERET